MKNYMKKTNKGFTLIELTIVIAIIGILSAVVLVNLQTSRQRGEDSKREQSMRAVRTALELYGEKNKYDYSGLFIVAPPASSHTDTNCNLFDDVAQKLVNLKYLSAVPTDPRDTAAGPTCYKLAVILNNATYGTIVSAYAIEWQKYKNVNANRKVGFVVSKSGDPVATAGVACLAYTATYLFPVFDPTSSGNGYCNTAVLPIADLLLGTSAGN